MSLDGLSKKTRRDKKMDKKIYQASSRINFLVEQAKTMPPASKNNEPDEQAKNQYPAEEREFIHQPPLKPARQIERPPVKKAAILKIVLIIILIVLVSGAMYLSEIVFSSSKNSLAGLNKFNPLKQLARLVTSPDKRVAGEFNDRVNILAMGMGGPGHDGPYLTDTIIVISLKPSTGEVGLISLPRDMVVQLNSGEWVKINQVYAMGRATDEKQAAEYARQIIEKTLDLPIHYYGIISFQGFEEFIDNIGGILVKVEAGFVDNQYPTADYKTTTVAFEAGEQLMDGQTALIFARSRHGTNFEGSDFARSRRQQLILQAIKEKVLKFSTLLSPTKLSSIFKLVDDYVETDLSVWQAIKIAKMVENTADNQVYRFVLDDSPESLLEPGFTGQGAWILQPKNGNFQAIQRMVNNIFNIGYIKEEAAKIEIQNGIAEPGLAFWTAVHLERLGYDIIKYGNALSDDYQTSVIYDISDDKKKKTLKWLKEELYAYVAKTVPDYILENYPYLNSTSSPELAENYPDFIAVLGQNYAEIFKLPEEKPVETATSTDAWATSTDEILEEEE
ncbi:LCP family protein [Patescibacteria group bacterium]|nr:LCP family protein [Patescibacteria group bacterium]